MTKKPLNKIRNLTEYERILCADPSEIQTGIHTNFPLIGIVLTVVSNEEFEMSPPFFPDGLRDISTAYRFLETVVSQWTQ